MTSAARAPLYRRPATLVIDARTETGRALLSPRGELVRGCVDTLATTLAALPAGVVRVELDMSAVHFMDSTGLEFLELLNEYGWDHGLPVSATAWDGQPRRILELAGLDSADPLHTGPQDPGPAPGPEPPAPSPSLSSSAVSRERAERIRVLEEEMDQLRRAIASRPLIDQARGVLMAVHACTSDQAWDILRETSQRSNTKLHTVAEAVTASITADGPPLPQCLRGALRAALLRHRAHR
ncbi:ANTAR domain-containing protein [Streptomyces sp. NPDC004542]|uniref:ANTAR domain-containing protein n=1 Tax=Streptomyces sp. NPDC004542 TaxID=3154281 RepID=UPI00339F3B63